MTLKSGMSHGLAAFGTLIFGTTLSKFIWDILPPLGELALLSISTLQSITGANIPVNERFAGTIVVMVILSFIWGVVYHLGRHGRGESENS
jgi:hypothetical protein